MANERRILATGIADREHLAVFEAMINERFGGIDTGKVMIYIIDTVDASALYSLAKQFDLLGYKGWKLAQNEQERRDLIKRAIELHRFKGTPWAIKEAVKAVGFFDAQILEGVEVFHDATISRDGAYEHGGSNWAHFSVVLDIGNYKGLTEQFVTDVKALINEYKNVRSRLIYLSYMATLEDEMFSTDPILINMEHDLPNELSPYIHNSTLVRNGNETHGRGGDVFAINIISIP